MKYSIEEIKTLLEGITPGAWAAEEVQYQWKTSNALGKHILCIYTEPDAKFIAAAPTINPASSMPPMKRGTHWRGWN